MVTRWIAAMVALGAVVAGTTVPLPSAEADGSAPPDGERTAGPPYDFATQLLGEELGEPLVPLLNQALITRSQHGYLYRAGQQDTRLRITVTDGGLRFADRGTKSFKRVAIGCRRVPVRRGVAALCPVPSTISVDAPLLVEVWPRLGNDWVDGHTLPATFAMTVLGDRGRERVRFGAGPDFFNGFMDTDRVSAGLGNDWIRSGPGRDVIDGGDDDDQIVDLEGNDFLLGGNGEDRIGGGPGDDQMDGGPGEDFLLCGPGQDDVRFDPLDRLLDC